jgi:hypothetical protein
VKKSRDSRTPGGDDAGTDVEFVGLEKLDTDADPSEVQALAASDPGLDSPGDTAVLDQEEFMEGLSSESMPSQHLDKS